MNPAENAVLISIPRSVSSVHALDPNSGQVVSPQDKSVQFSGAAVHGIEAKREMPGDNSLGPSPVSVMIGGDHYPEASSDPVLGLPGRIRRVKSADSLDVMHLTSGKGKSVNLVRKLVMEGTDTSVVGRGRLLTGTGMLGTKIDKQCQEVRNAVLMMSIVNELKVNDQGGDKRGYSIANLKHEVIQKLLSYYETERCRLNEVYELCFPITNDRGVIDITIIPASPTTLPTPQPGEVSEEDIRGAFLKACQQPLSVYGNFNSETFKWRCDTLKNISHGGTLTSSTEKRELKLFVRFRSDLPTDQEISDHARYRLLAGDEGFYISDSLSVAEKGLTLFIEFQIPLLQEVEPDLDKIIDISKEYQATLGRLKRKPDSDSSFDTPENKARLQTDTIPIVKNMEQGAPEQNAFTGKFLGSGIAQKVFEHVYPSIALKFLPRPMDNVESCIVKNTLNITQALTELVMEMARMNGIKLKFSPILYVSVVDHNLIEDAQSGSASSESDDEGSDLMHHRVARVHTSPSECESIVELRPVPLTVDGMVTPVPNEVKPSFKSERIWIAGMQRKYEKKQMVEYILQDPEENTAVKIEIIKKILEAIDVFDDFNKSIALPDGERLIKCGIDGNFGNFAFDKDTHDLIYLDVAPATLSINGRVVPGNQFMMSWFPSRKHFNYRLATDPQMDKLFVNVMVTNPLRKLEDKIKFYKSEGVQDSDLDKRVKCLEQVVNSISTELQGDSVFIGWCNQLFFTADGEEIKSRNLREPALKSKLVENIQRRFDRYVEGSTATGEELGVSDFSQPLKLEISERIMLIRLLSDAVADRMAKIKQDEAKISQIPVKRASLISTGVKEMVRLGRSEVKAFAESVIFRSFDYFDSKEESPEKVFGDVVFSWLSYCGNREVIKKCREFGKDKVLDKLGCFKGVDDAELPVSDCQKKVLTVSGFQKALYEMSDVKFDVYTVEAFSGQAKEVVCVQYNWGLNNEGDDIISRKESMGDGVFSKLIHQASSDVIVLVNNEVGRPYLMDDVRDYVWSSVYLEETRKTPPNMKEAILPLEFIKGTSEYSQAVFSTMVSALSQLYSLRIDIESISEATAVFSLSFFEKVGEWMPGDCVCVSDQGLEKKSISVEMNLSSNSIFGLKPLLRGYFDMMRDCSALTSYPTRLYIIAYFPEPGCYARWMFRTTTRNEDQVLSYMNFRDRFSLETLKSEVDSSSESGTVDFIFLKGGYGYKSGQFQLNTTPEFEVSIGYNKGVFDRVMRDHPMIGGAFEASEARLSGSEYTDGMDSLELSGRVF